MFKGLLADLGVMIPEGDHGLTIAVASTEEEVTLAEPRMIDLEVALAVRATRVEGAAFVEDRHLSYPLGEAGRDETPSLVIALGRRR